MAVTTSRSSRPINTENQAAGEEQYGSFAARVKRLVAAVDRFQQTHRAVSMLVAVFKKFADDQAGNLAALVAYYSFFSIFPMLLVFVAVMGFALEGSPETKQRLVDSALTNFPVVGDQLRSSIGTPTGSGLAVVIGIVAALWAGMGAISAMQNTMNSIWDVPLRDRPAMVAERVRSMLMLALLAATVGVTTLLGGTVAVAGSWPFIGRAVVLLPALLVNFVLFAVSFKVLTTRALSWSSLLPGALAASVAFTILQTAGTAYVTYVIKGANNTYGTFAVVLGLLSWLYLQAQLVVLCAELNVVRAHHLYPRSLLGSPLTDGDARALRSYANVEQRHPAETIEVHLDPSHVAQGTGAISLEEDHMSLNSTTPPDHGYPNRAIDRPVAAPTAPLRGDPDTVEEPGTGDLLGQVGFDLGELITMHIDLAKTEIEDEIADAAKTAGAVGAGAFAGSMAVLLLSFTVAAVLMVWLPTWAAFLIVTAVWTMIALMSMLAGRTKAASLGAAPTTVETLKEDIEWAQQRKV
ncbi:MAG: YihY family inner membrane protein [Actinobacteria bacterium]|nr:YihY family inner membrane protein [Actinomycetota bacterium]